MPATRRVITMARASNSSGEKGVVRMSSTPRSNARSFVLRSPRRVRPSTGVPVRPEAARLTEQVEQPGAVVVVHVDNRDVQQPLGQDRHSLGKVGRDSEIENPVIERQPDQVHDHLAVVEDERPARGARCSADDFEPPLLPDARSGEDRRAAWRAHGGATRPRSIPAPTSAVSSRRCASRPTGASFWRPLRPVITVRHDGGRRQRRCRPSPQADTDLRADGRFGGGAAGGEGRPAAGTSQLALHAPPVRSRSRSGQASGLRRSGISSPGRGSWR